MRIQQSQVSLSAQHSLMKSQERTESLKAWVGDRPAPGAGDRVPTVLVVSGPHDTLTISPEARKALAALQANQAQVAPAGSVEEPIETLSPRDQVIITILERMFGIRIRFLRARDLQENPDQTAARTAALAKAQAARSGQRAGWGFDYQLSETYRESEQTTVSGQGVIQTADGKRIDFSVQLNMSREFHSEHSVSIKAGDALVDPLVINYGGQAAELSPDDKMSFDLNLDGQGESVALLKDGSGYLALDQNGDGTINNGAELFGPTSGDGFAELRRYDVDQNNWIDENDPIYQNLRIWSRDAEGRDRLFALGQLGIGAIYLGAVDAPFTMKDGNNQTTGQVQQVSVFARENGSVGTVQQLDVVV